ncbi:unnamed protein product [Chrysoparadoxa australica]
MKGSLESDGHAAPTGDDSLAVLGSDALDGDALSNGHEASSVMGTFDAATTGTLSTPSLKTAHGSDSQHQPSAAHDAAVSHDDSVAGAYSPDLAASKSSVQVAHGSDLQHHQPSAALDGVRSHDGTGVDAFSSSDVTPSGSPLQVTHEDDSHHHQPSAAHDAAVNRGDNGAGPSISSDVFPTGSAVRVTPGDDSQHHQPSAALIGDHPPSSSDVVPSGSSVETSAHLNHSSPADAGSVISSGHPSHTLPTASPHASSQDVDATSPELPAARSEAAAAPSISLGQMFGRMARGTWLGSRTDSYLRKASVLKGPPLQSLQPSTGGLTSRLSVSSSPDGSASGMRGSRPLNGPQPVSMTDKLESITFTSEGEGLLASQLIPGDAPSTAAMSRGDDDDGSSVNGAGGGGNSGGRSRGFASAGGGDGGDDDAESGEAKDLAWDGRLDKAQAPGAGANGNAGADSVDGVDDLEGTPVVQKSVGDSERNGTGGEHEGECEGAASEVGARPEAEDEKASEVGEGGRRHAPLGPVQRFLARRLANQAAEDAEATDQALVSPSMEDTSVASGLPQEQADAGEGGSNGAAGAVCAVGSQSGTEGSEKGSLGSGQVTAAGEEEVGKEQSGFNGSGSAEEVGQDGPGSLGEGADEESPTASSLARPARGLHRVLRSVLGGTTQASEPVRGDEQSSTLGDEQSSTLGDEQSSIKGMGGSGTVVDGVNENSSTVQEGQGSQVGDRGNAGSDAKAAEDKLASVTDQNGSGNAGSDVKAADDEAASVTDQNGKASWLPWSPSDFSDDATGTDRDETVRLGAKEASTSIDPKPEVKVADTGCDDASYQVGVASRLSWMPYAPRYGGDEDGAGEGATPDTEATSTKGGAEEQAAYDKAASVTDRASKVSWLPWSPSDVTDDDADVAVAAPAENVAADCEVDTIASASMAEEDVNASEAEKAVAAATTIKEGTESGPGAGEDFPVQEELTGFSNGEVAATTLPSSDKVVAAASAVASKVSASEDASSAVKAVITEEQETRAAVLPSSAGAWGLPWRWVSKKREQAVTALARLITAAPSAEEEAQVEREARQLAVYTLSRIVKSNERHGEADQAREAEQLLTYASAQLEKQLPPRVGEAGQLMDLALRNVKEQCTAEVVHGGEADLPDLQSFALARLGGEGIEAAEQLSQALVALGYVSIEEAEVEDGEVEEEVKESKVGVLEDGEDEVLEPVGGGIRSWLTGMRERQLHRRKVLAAAVEAEKEGRGEQLEEIEEARNASQRGSDAADVAAKRKEKRLQVVEKKAEERAARAAAREQAAEERQLRREKQAEEKAAKAAAVAEAKAAKAAAVAEAREKQSEEKAAKAAAVAEAREKQAEEKAAKAAAVAEARERAREEKTKQREAERRKRLGLEPGERARDLTVYLEQRLAKLRARSRSASASRQRSRSSTSSSPKGVGSSSSPQPEVPAASVRAEVDWQGLGGTPAGDGTATVVKGEVLRGAASEAAEPAGVWQVWAEKDSSAQKSKSYLPLQPAEGGERAPLVMDAPLPGAAEMEAESSAGSSVPVPRDQQPGGRWKLPNIRLAARGKRAGLAEAPLQQRKSWDGQPGARAPAAGSGTPADAAAASAVAARGRSLPHQSLSSPGAWSFPVATLAAVGLALLRPDLCAWSGTTGSLSTFMACMMACVGMHITASPGPAVPSWQQLSLSVAVPHLVMPLLSLALTAALQLPPSTGMGLLLLSAVHGSPASSLTAMIGGGSTSLSAASLVFSLGSTLGFMAFAPSLARGLGFSFGLSGTSGATPAALLLRVAAASVQLAAAPLLVGMLLGRAAPEEGRSRMQKLSPLLGAACCCVMLMGGLAGQARTVLAAPLATVHAPVLLLQLLGGTAGLAISRWLGLSTEASRSVGLDMMVRPSMLALVLARLYGGDAAAAMAAPAAASVLWTAVIGSVRAKSKDLPLLPNPDLANILTHLIN